MIKRIVYMSAFTLFLMILTLLKPVYCSSEKDEISGKVDQFFLSYVQTIEATHGLKSVDKFLDQNTFLTSDFKRAYHKLLDDALKEDPELGLDYDPILDAQDIPSKPLKAISIDISGNISKVEVKSEDWPDDIIRVVLVKRKDAWLINSINKINPPSKTDKP